LLTSYIAEHLPMIKCTIPEATYLGWLDCRALELDGSPYKFFLNEAKVALSDGAMFGAGGEGHVRINFGCPREQLIEALERMCNAVKRVTRAGQMIENLDELAA
jgi:cystathionine beta-lyase